MNAIIALRADRSAPEAEPAASPIQAPCVMSPCPLLTDEAADAVLPGTGLFVPSNTAWTVTRLDLMNFSDADGSVNEAKLDHALSRCIDAGNGVHDRDPWSCAAMRKDSRDNRRIAVQVMGIGDLVLQRNDCPEQFDCLQNLDGLIARIRWQLIERSRNVARDRDVLPSIAATDPCAKLGNNAIQNTWRSRWRECVNKHALYNRNVLAIAPAALFPRDGNADARFVDLMPLLRHADVSGLLDDQHLSHWKPKQFNNFQTRFAAFLQHRNSLALIAKAM